MNVHNVDIDIFMHGLCVQFHKELNNKFNLKPINIHDYEIDFDNECEYEVLVHTASILPNGQIIDAEYVYKDENEFMKYVSTEFEEMNEFFIVKGKEAEIMVTKQLKFMGGLKDNLSIEKGNKEQLEYLNWFIGVLSTTYCRKNPIPTIVNDYKKYVVNNKERVKKMFTKNNNELINLFKNSKYFYNDKDFDDILMLKIPLSDKSYFIMLPSCCYLVTYNKPMLVYSLNKHSITECKINMAQVIKNYELDKDLINFTIKISLR